MYSPSLRNLNLLIESVHGVQVSQVDGQCCSTPSSLHRDFVALFATQPQSLVIVDPSLTTLNLKGESSHEDAVELDVGNAVGDAVGKGVTTEDVGDVVGVDVGDTIGDTVGTNVGDAVGDAVGKGVTTEDVGDAVGDAVGDGVTTGD